MIIGIGIDIMEIERIAAILKRTPRFPEKILSPRELALFQELTSEKRKVEFLAGRFSAKEAFSKAYGTGIGKEIGFHDMEVLQDERGKPIIPFRDDIVVHVSISHSEHYVVAQVVLEKRNN